MTPTEELIDVYARLQLHEANEAETRLKLIDRILFDILGWSHDDVSVEERVSEDGKITYADYIVRTAGASFILEAKKTGADFSSVPDVRKRRLSGNFVQGATGDAILQARDYCRKKSVPFAVVTNGSQWIIFPAVRVDQVPFADSSAVIFSSLESALRDNFTDFRDLLSRSAVIAGSMETELLGRIDDQLEARRLKSQFTNRSVTSTHNPLFPLIEDAIVTAFTDSIVDSSPELLKKCYVQTPERIRFDSQISMYISRKLPVVGERPIRPLSGRDASTLRSTIERSSIVARPIAILVLGTVGAGKSTFLRFTRSVSSASYFERSENAPYPHWIHIDFRAFSPTGNANDFLYQAIRQYVSADHFLSNFEQCIRPAYIDQIRALRDGPLKLVAADTQRVNERIADYLLAQSGTTEYVDRILRYATTKAPVFLVVDNVDQFESGSVQAGIFSESMALASRTGSNLVLAMRDSTFVNHRSAPTFNAFDFVPIAIDPPAIPAVLSRRFFLAKQLLSGRSGSFTSENGAHVEVRDLSIIANMVASSVLGSSIGTVIDVLATSDVRLALRMTREFLESGYTNPGRAVNAYQTTGNYTLPRHEALRSVLLGNAPVYSEQYSIIGNPFDARMSKNSHQPLRLFVLAGLVSFSSRPDFRYLDGAEISVALKELGFGDAATSRVVSDLCALRFVFTAGHSEPGLTSSFYPSRLGGYVVRLLLADTTFLEAMMMDTFIADGKVWDDLRTLSERIEEERNIVNRLIVRQTRIQKFFAYMGSLYSVLLDEARRRSLSAEWCTDPFDSAQKVLARGLKRQLASAKRNYGR